MGLDDMGTLSLTGAILTPFMTRTTMYSKTITVLGTIPPETSERSEPPEQSSSDGDDRSADSDSSPTTSDEDGSSDFKEEKSPRAADASFGSPPGRPLQVPKP